MLTINAKTVNDAWFQLLTKALEQDGEGEFVNAYPTGIIQRGSFELGQSRLQFPGVAVEIEYPDQDYCVVMPAGLENMAPTTLDKVESYFHEYILGDNVPENTTYTYGSRINVSLAGVIEMLQETPVTNQAVIEIGRPEDYDCCKGKDGKDDPPCLRLIDLKVRPAYKDGELDRAASKLDLTVYFRSWDLFAGFPENLGGMSLLQQTISGVIGIPVGRMYAYSAGLHLYGYQKELAEIRTRMKAS
ncbi:MAG TPA: thymidylate synthase, partial [Nitrospirota bacterium]